MDVNFEVADLGQLEDGVDDDKTFPPEASDNNSTGGMVLQEHDPFNDPPSDPQGIDARNPKLYVMLFVLIFSSPAFSVQLCQSCKLTICEKTRTTLDICGYCVYSCETEVSKHLHSRVHCSQTYKTFFATAWK
jgi:hypothetical protein